MRLFTRAIRACYTHFRYRTRKKPGRVDWGKRPGQALALHKGSIDNTSGHGAHHKTAWAKLVDAHAEGIPRPEDKSYLAGSSCYLSQCAFPNHPPPHQRFVDQLPRDWLRTGAGPQVNLNLPDLHVDGRPRPTLHPQLVTPPRHTLEPAQWCCAHPPGPAIPDDPQGLARGR